METKKEAPRPGEYNSKTRETQSQTGRDRDRHLGIASELHMCTVTHCIHVNTRELTQRLEKIIYLKVLSWSFINIDGFILL